MSISISISISIFSLSLSLSLSLFLLVILFLYLYLYIKLEVDFDLVYLKIYNEFCDNSRCRNLTLPTGLELRAIHSTNTALTPGSKGGPWRYYPQPPLAGFYYRIKL
jgi:hypothetical protein